MKRLLSTVALATLLATSAFAQSGGPGGNGPRPGMMNGAGMGMGMPDGMAPRDCSKAPDAAHCKAVQAAFEACKGMSGMERRECLEDKMPAPDCSKAPDPEQCRKHQAAHQACKDKPVGPQRHQCVMDKMGVPGRK